MLCTNTFSHVCLSQLEVLTPPAAFEQVKNALSAAGLNAELAEVTFRPENTIEIEGDDAVKMQKILDVLEDLDDVQEIYHNAALWIFWWLAAVDVNTRWLGS